MAKKRSPTYKIESDKSAREGEKAYMKLPGKLVDITGSSSENSVMENFDLMEKEYNKSGRKYYSHLHTHPIPEETYKAGMGSLPSKEDFVPFLLNNDEKTMIIAQQSPETGKVQGYYFFRKTKKTPKSNIENFPALVKKMMGEDAEKLGEELYKKDPFVKKVQDDAWNYRLKAVGRFSHAKPPKEREEALNEMTEKYKLQQRYVPAPGFEFERGTKFSRKKDDLEKIAAVFLIIGLTLILLVNPSITGFAVLDNSYTSSLLVVGIFLILISLGTLILKKFR